MPSFNSDNTEPKPVTTEVSDGARTAFQRGGDALFSKLGLGDGGFQANADRVFMLDDTGKLVPAPPYDERSEESITAAAQSGRLFVMDKNYRLRHVQLQKDENDIFAFMITKPLGLRQLPRLSMDYFLKQFENICKDFVRDMSQTFNEAKENMSKIFDKYTDRMSENFSNMKAGWARVFGGRNAENEQAELKLNTEQPSSGNEPLENEQTNTTLGEDQTPHTQIKPWKYQAKDTRNMSNDAFLDHVKAACKRGEELSVTAVLTGKDCTPDKYFDVVTRQLESKVAGEILQNALDATTEQQRNTVLAAHKKTYTAMVVGLGDYVVSHTNKADLTEHCKHPTAPTPESRALSKSSDEILLTGVKGYLSQLNRENTEIEQAMQQTHPKKEAALENAPSKKQQELNPFTK